MKAYVLLKVTYDWFRFQENLGVFDSAIKARYFASQLEEPLCGIFEYVENYSDIAFINERSHYQIQEFEIQ